MRCLLLCLFIISLLLSSENSFGATKDEDQGTVDVAPVIGPKKGILKASAEQGIILAPEAVRRFELRYLKLRSPSPWQIPSSALLTSGEEFNIYRLRQGFLKRIDIEVVEKSGANLLLISKDLKPGDEILINSVGLVRIAEISAFSTESEEQSH